MITDEVINEVSLGAKKKNKQNKTTSKVLNKVNELRNDPGHIFLIFVMF